MPNINQQERTIHKFPFQYGRLARIEAPKGSKLLTIQVQHGTICAWYEVPVGVEETELHEYLVYGTGDSLEADIRKEYKTTVQDGPYVWHVYQITE